MIKKNTAVILSILFFCIFSIFAASANAATTVYSSGDSFITGDGQTNSNNGSSNNLRIKHPTGNSHVLLRFSPADISSAVGFPVHLYPQKLDCLLKQISIIGEAGLMLISTG